LEDVECFDDVSKGFGNDLDSRGLLRTAEPVFEVEDNGGN
jgi:hypothetical protein